MLAAQALAALHDDRDTVGRFAALGHQAPYRAGKIDENNFSPSVDAVVKQLQAAEETRRAKESRDLRKPPTG